MPPFRASVVHLVDFKKEEFLDRHESHAPPPAGKRPFLCVLSPDTLQLVTASDASDGPAPALLKLSSTIMPDRTPRPHMRPISLLHKLAHGTAKPVVAALGVAQGQEGQAASEAAGGSRPSSRGAGEEEDGELGESLDEGQLLKFTIALSQVAGIERNEQRIKVTFHRQKPHLSAESSDDWKAMMKAAVLPFAMPYEAYKHRNWEVGAYINRHRRDPFVSSVVLEADSSQEAATLHMAIESAIARLAHAVQWLSQDLPLQGRPVVTLVTVTSHDADGAGTAAALGSAASPMRGGAGDGAGGAPPGAAEQIVCAFPRMQQPLDISIPAPAPLDAADVAGAGAASGDEDELAVHVWLHSPLGPAVATITTEQLQRSAEAGGAPLVVVATPQQQAPAEAEEALPSVRDKLDCVLQFKAERLATPRRISSFQARSSAGSGLGGGAASTAAAAAAAAVASSSQLSAILAVLCVPLLAALMQLGLHTEGGAEAASNILTSVAFLISSLAAVAAIVAMQLRGQAPQQAEQLPPPPPVGRWRLVLLHADLMLESQRSCGAPTVRRVVSTSDLASTAPSSGMVLRLDGTAAELPQPMRRLVEQHPAVLTDDIAARFMVGLGSADKAYLALKNMVEWVEAQGVADLVNQPQPRFELIKKHYPQVFYCWSSKADCVLEVELTGRWREAFDALKALGVTDRELLRHLFFCTEYAFKVLDTRPLPQGKTVKIIDLEGLSMRDVSSTAFKWYLQVGGALLATNYPQRLHKAFLLNAPAWSGVIWKVLAVVIPRKTREQLMLFTCKQKEAAVEALMQWVPAEQLPVQYGGKCTVPLNETDLEREMATYVARLNRSSSSRSSSPSKPPALALAAAGIGGGAAEQRVAE